LFHGERLKALREERRMTQGQLAKILGVSTPSVTDYEMGKKTPRPDRLIKLSDYFDTSVDYLLGTTDERDPIDKLKKDVLSHTPDLEKILLEYAPKFENETITREEADLLIGLLRTMSKQKEKKKN
jgi:transcriptional regulator with XRE-family HTH domain